MAASAKHIPTNDQMLCEGCGYILEGLPPEANCPECGKPARESTDPGLRQLPAWERAPSPVTFITTSLHVLFRPSHFFRHMVTRQDTIWSKVFAGVWLVACSLMLSITGLVHALWLEGRSWGPPPQWIIWVYAILKVFALPAVLVSLLVISEVASRLTAWEAAYRGLRLPLSAVRRAMRYHSVHIVPVCAAAMLTVVGYRMMRENGIVTVNADLTYLYVLSGEVIFFAAYLFFTYWAAMRNMLFANK